MNTPEGFDPHRSALFTDLYELTMLQAYFAEGLNATAVFELFFRELPERRNYVMAAGIDDALDYLENLAFSPADRDWLHSLGRFSDAFIEQLASLRFTGDVYAVPEGTVVFGNEPVVQVIAPLPEAQIIETYLLNQIHLQSLAATKAARVVTAAAGRPVVDFGSRRSHGTDAALKVARASYLAGAAGTSNVAASRMYDIPPVGTMAHSYVKAHNDELTAFRTFTREFPDTTLLIDTYDTRQGARNVVRLAKELGEAFRVRAVRIDSGNLLSLSRSVRRILDAGGLQDVQIVATSGLDEYSIARLVRHDAPIDAFGVGTELAVSGDEPDIDFSYKLVSVADVPRMKLSARKRTLPGRKQVFRRYVAGEMVDDTIANFAESLEGEALLVPYMRDGRRLDSSRTGIETARRRAAAQLAALPAALHRRERAQPGYPVIISAELQDTTDEVIRRLAARSP